MRNTVTLPSSTVALASQQSAVVPVHAQPTPRQQTTTAHCLSPLESWVRFKLHSWYDPAGIQAAKSLRVVTHKLPSQRFFTDCFACDTPQQRTRRDRLLLQQDLATPLAQLRQFVQDCARQTSQDKVALRALQLSFDKILGASQAGSPETAQRRLRFCQLAMHADKTPHFRAGHTPAEQRRRANQQALSQLCSEMQQLLQHNTACAQAIYAPNRLQEGALPSCMQLGCGVLLGLGVGVGAAALLLGLPIYLCSCMPWSVAVSMGGVLQMLTVILNEELEGWSVLNSENQLSNFLIRHKQLFLQPRIANTLMYATWLWIPALFIPALAAIPASVGSGLFLYHSLAVLYFVCSNNATARAYNTRRFAAAA